MGRLLGYALLLTLIVGSVLVAALVWLGAKDRPSEAFETLTAPPPDFSAATADNGYFTMIGFAAGPNADPAKTGYDIWREAEDARGHYYFDYSKEGRTELQVQSDLLQMIQAWKSDDPITKLSQLEETLQTFQSRHKLLLERYTQWLSMPFDDEGYGHAGTPRLAEVFLAHRVYVAEGFKQGLSTGVDRLATDLATWRLVIEHAKTPSVKLLAAAAIGDDAKLVSAMLSRQPDDATVKRLTDLAQPLTVEERSIRWLLQHEFVRGISRYKSVPLAQGPGPSQQSDENARWLIALTGLADDVLDRIKLPLPPNPILRAMMKKQRTMNIYAAYYEAVLKASGVAPIKLPALREIGKQGSRSLADPLLNPIDNVFSTVSEPTWTSVLGYIMEADARLRLAGLQVILRNAPKQQPMAVAIGQAGPDYYDPFMGIPMVWNASQGVLYSVGKDGRDDGGESSFDVSVKLEESPPLAPVKAPTKPGKPAKPAKPGAKPAPQPAKKAPAA
jgi:hypothetical protein